MQSSIPLRITVPLVILSTLLSFGFAIRTDRSSAVIASPLVENMAAQPSGKFQSVEHPTSGNARLITNAKQRHFLVLDNSFKTDPGPDLYVVLHRSNQPQTYNSKDYVILERLQKVSGQQQYAIPSTINLSEYQSVVIWCRQFNVTFGYAPLTPTMPKMMQKS
jgi:Electron transfer DM13